MRKLQTLLLLMFVSVLSTYADRKYWQESLEDPATYSYKITGEGGNNPVFEVKSVKDLAYIAYMVNVKKDQNFISNLQKGTILLKTDIDLAEHRWVGLGESGLGGFTGTLDGDGHTIFNMECSSGNGDANAGFIDTGGTGMTIKNITFKDCNSYLTEACGIVVGSMDDASKVTFTNVKLESCRANSETYSGLLIGYAKKCKELKISDITISEKWTKTEYNLLKYLNFQNVHADAYAGGMIGWMRDCDGFEIDNVTLKHTGVHGDKFVGGLVGEIMGSSGTIKNCFVSPTITGRRDCTGGIVGKMYNSGSKVQIQNCVVDINYQKFFSVHQRIGGVVGYVNNGAYATLNNVAVIAEPKNVSFNFNDDQGLLVGCNWDDKGTSCGYVTANACYIDRAYSDKSSAELEEIYFGASIVKWRRKYLSYSDLNAYTSGTQDVKALSLVTKMNALGGCFGATDNATNEVFVDSCFCNPFCPLKSKEDGMLVGYTYDSSPSIISAETLAEGNSSGLPASLSLCPEDRMVIMKYGHKTKYQYEKSSNIWIVDTSNEGLKSNERNSGLAFTAVPETTGSIHVKTSTRPVVKLKSHKYNATRNSVTLNWTITKGYEKDDWKDAKFVVSRLYQGEVKLDTLDIDQCSWTDYSPDVNQEWVEYKISFISQTARYEASDNGSYGDSIRIATTASNTFTIEEPVSKDRKVHVRAKIPNSSQFDGTLRLLKWTTGDKDSLINHGLTTEDAIEDYILSNPADFEASHKEFKFAKDSKEDYSYVDLTDDLKVGRCTMTYYIVLCDNLPEGSAVKRHSNSKSYIPKDKVTFTKFTASKGESTSKVKLAWTVKNPDSDDMLFVISRKMYDANSTDDNESDWLQITTVNGISGNMSYEDETYPGYVYKYRLRAHPSCDSQFDENVYDNEITDIGFASSRGTIMGTITYNGGNTNVKGVDVQLSSDASSLEDKTPSYAMSFNNENECLPLMSGMGKNFWNGDWTIQFMMRPEKNITDNEKGVRVMALPGRFVLNMKGDSLLMAGKPMKLNVRSWDNHIVLLHKDGKYIIGVTGSNDSNETLTQWADTVTDNEMASWIASSTDAVLKDSIDTLYFGLTERELSHAIEANSLSKLPQTFIGHIDEVRLWNSVLTEEEQKNTFDRYLTGAETKLRAYYTFDTGVAEYAFDYSHPSGVWSNHHSKLPNVGYPESVSDYAPDAENLSYRGTTDENGTYQIAGIPFVGEGTNYQVVPVYGTHVFQPSSIRRYVSNQSLTHSNVDFTDKSSFSVNVEAHYALGNYPAKGLTVLIDNVAATKDGRTITTDNEGKATIEVPIGQHKLALTALGHNMVNNGYPCSVTGINADGTIAFTPLNETEQEGYMDFQSDRVAAVQFYDGTFVRLAGKIVGGKNEEEQPVGFNLTHANLGNAGLTIEPRQMAGKYSLYNLGAEVKDLVLTNSMATDTLGNGNINSTTTYKYGTSTIEIDIDPVTGEYLALVPPIDMVVKGVRTKGTYGTQLIDNDFRMNNMPVDINIDANKLQADTLREGESLTNFQVFKYHAKKNYIYYVEPEFSMYNPDVQNSKDSLMFGDEYYFNRWTDDNGVETVDSVSLWSESLRDGSSKSYLITTTDSQGDVIGHPVFSTGNLYRTYMSIYEKYTNLTTGKDTLYSQDGIKISIYNHLSTKGFTSLESGYKLDETKSDTTNIIAPSDGIIKYEWYAGYPSPVGDHTLEMDITYNANGKDYNAAHVSGIVVGAVPIPGTNFVTAGPNNVAFVLRDPPGSASYSWIDKGSTITHTTFSEHGYVGNHDLSTAWYTGTSSQTINGAGFLPGGPVHLTLTSSSDNYSKIGSSLVTSVTAGDNTSHTLTFTTTDKIQTSSSDSYVGSEGDVYIGTGRNLTFAQCNVVGFLRVEKEQSNTIKSKLNHYYILNQDKSIASTDSFTTLFMYSQKHIVNELIPELKKLRHARVNVWVDDPKSYIPNASELKEKQFFFAVKKSLQKEDSEIKNEQDFWKEGEDYVAFEPTDKNAATADSINLYSQWIRQWNLEIKKNEKTKYETAKNCSSRITYTDSSGSVSSDYGFMGNTSMDAGVTYTNTLTRTESEADGSYNSNQEQLTASTTGKFDTFLFIFHEKNKTTLSIKEGHSGKSTKNTVHSNTQAFGYSLHDAKSGNFFSVDTYLPGQITGKGTVKELNNINSKPKFDEFYVFRVRGGQSKCPYQEVETALQYHEGDNESAPLATLGDGTIAIEDPVLEFTEPNIVDVPSGQSYFTKIKVSNKSAATVKLASTFLLGTDQKTSADGLSMYIDGNVVGNNNSNSFVLMPGETIVKTLEIKQSDEKILNYDNIALRLASDCQPARASVQTFSIHFKAASSPVKLEQLANVVNTVNNADSSVTFRVSGYDVNRKGFAGIRLKYKKSGELNFNTYRILIADSLTYASHNGKFDWTDPTYIPLNKQATDPVTEVKVKMGGLDDGNYYFLAESFNPDGAKEITTSSDTLSVLKDTKLPQMLTAPSPTSGYYTIGSEISLQMNEDIQMENVSAANNISVTAVLNDARVTHSSALHFDGATPAVSSSRVQIFNKQSALAFWYRPVKGKKSCLLSQVMTDAQAKAVPMKLVYNEDGSLSVSAGGTSYNGKNQSITSDDWMYAMLTYNVLNSGLSEIKLYNLYGTSGMNESLVLSQQFANPAKNANVPLYVGGSEDNEECHADIEGLTVYEDCPSFESLSADKDNKHMQNVRGLLAYWPMDEGSGTVAHDRVRSRNLTLKGTDNWYIPGTNYVLNLESGDKYMAIKTGNCPINRYGDYVLEFWFRSVTETMKDGEEMTMFSNGLGEGDADEVQQADRLSISLGNKGQIILRGAGNKRELGSGYNDNQWHHLALNVQRDSYVNLLVDTIDISSSTTLSGDDFGAFSNSEMVLGALKYTQEKTGQSFTKNYFKGQIDEVRLWKAYRTNSNIKQSAFTRLSGNEVGLVAYYPFEKMVTVAKQEETDPYLGDCVQADKASGIVTADNPYISSGGTVVAETAELAQTVTTDDGPRLRSANILTPIDVDFTTNGKDKIVFTFPESLKKDRIEGCTLNFQVKNLKDLAGNPMRQSIDWSVYVKQNPLSWISLETNMVQEIGSSVKTRLMIYNNSSTSQNWNIIGLPTWATVSQSSGTVDPFDFDYVELSTVDGTAVGSYQGIIYLVGDDEIYNPLGLTLSVTAVAPDWKVAQTTGAKWMTIFGRLKINDDYADDENDIVGMFDDSGRCLALASPKYYSDQDSYFLTLNVKGNDDDVKKPLNFRVWDANSGIVYEGADFEYYKGTQLVQGTTQTFDNFAVLGSFSKPYIISAGKYIRQSIDLHKGWNWISLWVKPTVGSTADKVFAPIADKMGDLKSRTGAVTNKQLANMTLYPSNSYHVYLTEDAIVSVAGEKVDPATVGMKLDRVEQEGAVNWHWIGFPLWRMMTLSEAFADFKPQTDDIIKSEDAYAMYNGKAWIGDLKYLTPGVGYLYGYHGSETSQWHYPNKAAQKVSADGNGFALDVSPYEYEDYTFVDVKIVNQNGLPITGYEYQLAAFLNDECRGVAENSDGESCPICIFGDDGEVYSFKLFNKANGKVYDLEGSKEYDELTSPQTLTLTLISTIDGIDNVSADSDKDSWYTAGGAKVTNTKQHGIYVKRSGKKLIAR